VNNYLSASVKNIFEYKLECKKLSVC
jgi:hypothetical protein